MPNKSNICEKSPRKFHIHTFGCQMNENDSERIAGLLEAEGAVLSPSPEESDIIIVNTCAVREKPVEKLYSLLGRLERLKAKNKTLIGVAGCVAQLHKEELLAKKPFIDFIIGPGNYGKIAEILARGRENRVQATGRSRKWKEISSVARDNSFSGYITIMEGCNNFCAYCVVPFARGREKFRPLSGILREARHMAHQGYKEIQLLGQNVNIYKDPESGKNFSSLLKELDRVEGIQWIRFITSHPRDFSLEIAKTMKDAEKVCHQLHLPIQAGSDTVLKRMNRGYSRKEYLEKIDMLRGLMPEISLSTDIIVGFPGETKENFQETLEILDTVRYNNIFSFRYSARPRTTASRYKDSVPLKEKRDRLIQVQALQKGIQLDIHKRLVGKTTRVLCLGKSKKDPARFTGRNEAYQVVNFSAPDNSVGKFIPVRITDYGAYSLIGKAELK